VSFKIRDLPKTLAARTCYTMIKKTGIRWCFVTASNQDVRVFLLSAHTHLSVHLRPKLSVKNNRASFFPLLVQPHRLAEIGMRVRIRLAKVLAHKAQLPPRMNVLRDVSKEGTLRSRGLLPTRL
jgi:hypothetical protein